MRTSPFCVALALTTFDPMASGLTSLRSFPRTSVKVYLMLTLISTEDLSFFSFEDLAWAFPSLRFCGASVHPEDFNLFTGTDFLEGGFSGLISSGEGC